MYSFDSHRKKGKPKADFARCMMYMFSLAALVLALLAAGIALSFAPGLEKLQAALLAVAFVAGLGMMAILLFRIWFPVNEINDALTSLEKGINQEYFTNFLNTYRMESATIPDKIQAIFEYATEVSSREFANELVAKRAQCSALQSQINPHFLYNSLESIRGQALLDQAPNVAEVAAKLSSFFRYNISAEDDVVLLKEEIRNVMDYYFIQRFRFEDKFCLEIECEEQEAAQCWIPKLILQPIIENSIFHGLEAKDGPGLVKIKAVTTEKRLILTITDDGLGMSESRLEELRGHISDMRVLSAENESGHNGIALRNINQRIKLFFGSEYGLFVYSTPGIGTQVEVVLPLMKEHFRMTPAGEEMGNGSRSYTVRESELP